jgi:hypothetical protein
MLILPYNFVPEPRTESLLSQIPIEYISMAEVSPAALRSISVAYYSNCPACHPFIAISASLEAQQVATNQFQSSHHLSV